MPDAGIRIERAAGGWRCVTPLGPLPAARTADEAVHDALLFLLLTAGPGAREQSLALRARLAQEG